jgi:hypothetical protein
LPISECPTQIKQCEGIFMSLIDTMKTALHRQPFEPFRIMMSSGTAYDVRHPEFAWLLKGGVYVGLPPEQGDVPERAVFCSMLHIAAVETLAAA